MPFLFFVTGTLSSFFWYWLLQFLLEDGGVVVIDLSNPMVEHIYLGLIIAGLYMGLLLCFRILKKIGGEVTKYQQRLACFLVVLGLNLALLLRSVLVIRINLEENILHGFAQLSLDEVALVAWGTGGSVAGLSMGCGISIALTLLKE